MTAGRHRRVLRPPVGSRVVGLVGTEGFEFHSVFPSKDVNTPTKDRCGDPASLRREGGFCGPALYPWIVHLIDHDRAAHKPLAASNRVQAPIEHSHSEMIPRGGHRRQSLPGVGDRVVHFEGVHGLTSSLATHSIDLLVNHPHREGPPGRGHRGPAPQTVWSRAVSRNLFLGPPKGWG